MKKISELEQQKQELDRQIEKAYKAESAKALADIQEVIKQYKFTAQQVFPLADPMKKKKAPDRYYDPNTGKSWSGQGRMPKWLEGKHLPDFEIVQERHIILQTDPNNPFPIA